MFASHFTPCPCPVSAAISVLLYIIEFGNEFYGMEVGWEERLWVSGYVALEALREAWHGKRMTSDDIWRYAKVCRVANVMRPYLESLA